MKIERFDTGKKFVLSTILKNNRLDTYSRYINYAKENDYKCCSMMEFYKDPDNGKHFVLRHDVDFRSPSTAKMFYVERDLGVHSTYYFRKSTLDVSLARLMIDNGFEVGFHYETLSDYALENNLTSVSEKDIDCCKARLKEEIKEFNRLIGTNISSIVSHGAKKNIEIGKSNNLLLEGHNYEDYGVIFEGYDELLYEKHITSHIMDGNIRRNYGYYYETNPIDEINQGKKNIVFLTHPNHWYKTFPQKLWNILAFMLGRCSYGSTMKFNRVLKSEGA